MELIKLYYYEFLLKKEIRDKIIYFYGELYKNIKTQIDIIS